MEKNSLYFIDHTLVCYIFISKRILNVIVKKMKFPNQFLTQTIHITITPINHLGAIISTYSQIATYFEMLCIYFPSTKSKQTTMEPLAKLSFNILPTKIPCSFKIVSVTIVEKQPNHTRQKE